MNRLLQALGLMRVSEHERLLHHEILQPPISDRRNERPWARRNGHADMREMVL